ncbi:MAG TPA: RICIN domain-containing protein [Polyangiaceae bacterium]|nr:RICIN domain-containing protein [Polyangiaceae bacterium]
MLRRCSSLTLSLLAPALIAGCSVDYAAQDQTASEGTESSTQALAACEGDDVNYDYNAFAASLAVGIANELGRWDVASDFEVRSGKLELSATGNLRCGTGCPNTKGLLRLQDDSAATVPNHSPSIYRSKLTAWHGAQVLKLKELVNKMLYVDKGVYRLRAKHSGKYMNVDNGSYSDGATIEQRWSPAYAGADQWRIVLDGTTHLFKNVRSGKCIALASDSGANGTRIVQQTCSSSSTQNFDFASIGGDVYTVRTSHGAALDVMSGSTADDAPLIQYIWSGDSANQQWTFEKVGTTGHIDPLAVATAVYTMTARHSGKAIGIDNGSMTDAARAEQAPYVASDDRFHWYVMRTGSSYQMVNRRSGKCLGLEWSDPTSWLAQYSCRADDPNQRFSFYRSGDGYQILTTRYGKTVEVLNNSTGDGVFLGQGDTAWNHNRQFKLTPIQAGEPHRLTFAYKTADATCGEHNYWYNILRPNGQSLEAPQDTWVQLIFAGGKQSATGADVNPFIAQQTQGNLVAIDPTAGLNEGDTTTTGSCSVACTKYSTTSLVGACCSCNGMNKKYVRSAFSAVYYQCTG